MKILLHLKPTLFLLYGGHAKPVDLAIEPYGLHLHDRVELMTGRPYPNKRLSVACRKGRKFLTGFLLDVEHEPEFTLTARWAVYAERVVTHVVTYRLLDADFDAASAHMMLWYATHESLGGWSDRRPCPSHMIPATTTEPKMEVWPYEVRPNTIDRLDDGLIVERWQTFDMPTIERQRLSGEMTDERMPRLDSAFQPL